MLNYRSILSLLLVLVPATAAMAQGGDEGARYKLAQGYEQSGDLKNAARVYKELYDADPQSNTYFEGVRRTYLGMLRYPELLPIVEDRVRRFASDVDLRAQYADLLQRNHRHDDALKQWQTAIDTRSDDAFTYAVVAQSQIDNRLFDLAAQTYQMGRSRLGDPNAFADELAQVFGILGRYEDATNQYLSILDRSGSRIGSVMGMMASFTTNPRAVDAAISTTKGRLASRPGYEPYLDLLSWLYTEKGDYEGAFEMARKIDEIRNGHGSDIYAFADRALREGQYDAAIAAFEYFQKSYPKENPLYGGTVLGYAQALEGRYRAMPTKTRKDAEALVERYRAIIGENAGSPSAAEALLSVAHLQADELDEPKDAIATLARLREEFPKSPSIREATLLQGDLFLRMGDIAKAGELYDAVATGGSGSDEDERYERLATLRRGEVLFYTGKFKDAAALFDDLSGNTASDVANDALGYHFLLQENMGKNDSALAHYAAGSLLLMQRDWKGGMAEMEKAVSFDRPGALSDESLLGKARAQEMLGDLPGAVATLTGLVERFADGTVADQALFHAAELAEKLGDIPKATELYTRVLTEYSTSAYAARAREHVRKLRGEGGS
jgi:tetratricopeptide (TPR) repeat protein